MGISPQSRDDETEEVAEMPAGNKQQSHAAIEREAAQNGTYEERDSYTAKQVAHRCGTDAKTMRKFFRSSASTVEPVGQGGRYEFAAEDLPTIKQEFNAWRKKATTRSGATAPRSTSNGSSSTTKRKKQRPIVEQEPFNPGGARNAPRHTKQTAPVIAASEIELEDEVEEINEPSETDLNDIEDLDLDLDLDDIEGDE